MCLCGSGQDIPSVDRQEKCDHHRQTAPPPPPPAPPPPPPPPPPTDMSDSETTTPVEAPVPAACAEIKANLDKCVAANGAEGCKDLLEAFAACVKSAAAETS
ncbi:unnamed protein product [Gadus morhua 'NCC']